MNLTDCLDKLLYSFERYYNIKKGDTVQEPFVAEAFFISHNEQYFLSKKAKLAEINSNEYVYFYTTENLNSDNLVMLDEIAWSRGLTNVKPDGNHRNSDITLIILANQIDSDAFKLVHKLKHYQSYRFGLYGWSNYRLIALELSSGNLAYNRQGQSLKKLVSNIIK